MIYASIKKNEEQKVIGFKVEGHAGYAPHGQDIVCAAVSALVIGTVNGLWGLTDAEFDVNVDEGLTEVEINKPTPYSNVLMKSLFMSLDDIQGEYPEYLMIELK